MNFFENNRSREKAKEIYDARINDAIEIYNLFKNDFIYRNCPYCDNNNYINQEKFINLYDIVKCGICNSLYVNPVPNDVVLSYYYNNCKCNVLLDNLFQERAKTENDIVNDIRILKTIELLSYFSDKNEKINILEIGCGSGNFLNKLYNKLDNKKYNLYGIDIDENIIKKNKNKNIHLIAGNGEKLSIEKKFDLILNFELIEHLIDPIKFMENIYKLLNDDGYCLLTTPNSLGFETKLIGYNKYRLIAHSIFPPMHLNAFNPQNITYFFIKNNFKIIDIQTPGKLDVSIVLSSLDELDKLDNKKFGKIDKYSLEIQQTIQDIISYLNGSSHMLCIIKKNS